MNLRTFITQCLTDIVGGVQDAQNITDGDTVIPDVIKNFKAVTTGIGELQTIDFEVCVRTEERKGSEAKIGVETAVVGGGVRGHSGKDHGHTATLRFKIPVRLPSKK